MRFVFVTGMSGAGKSSALKMLEDMGYFCVDNLPIPLVPKLVELLRAPSAQIRQAALGVDIRGGQALAQLEEIINRLDGSGISYEILFLDASDATLVKRYKETRRTHPLAGDGRVDKGIQLERERLGFLKKKAKTGIDADFRGGKGLPEPVYDYFILRIQIRNPKRCGYGSGCQISA